MEPEIKRYWSLASPWVKRSSFMIKVVLVFSQNGCAIMEKWLVNMVKIPPESERFVIDE